MLLALVSSGQSHALQEPADIHFTVNSFQITGDNPLPEGKSESILNGFLGEHAGLEGLQAAINELEAALRDAGYAFYRVSLVPKELNQGIVELRISKININRILIRGNEHHSAENILNNSPTLEKGGAPNTSILSRAIGMANNNPTKNIKLQFSESEEGGSIDAKLSVEDSDPGFFFLALNNTGTPETGKTRLTLGYQMTNLFDHDHNLSLNYTTSPEETDTVKQYGFSYGIPFYESGSRIDLLVSHSDVDSGIVSQQFEVSGKGTVASLNYNKIFLQSSSYKHEMDINLSRKKFENDVIFLGFIQLGGDVVSRPLSITYKGSNLSTDGNLSFNIGMSSNISGGSLNEDINYEANRSGPNEVASADWSRFNYGLGYISFLTEGWLLRFNLSGQETSDLLISGEQFGLGGMNSVRGFEERAILGDKGYQVNLELWMPTFTSQKIRPLVFYDMGHTEVIDPQPGTAAEEDPASYGFGLRWSWKQDLSASIDYGYVSKAAGTAEKGDDRVHFDVFYRF